jgi:hypothetical protein
LSRSCCGRMEQAGLSPSKHSGRNSVNLVRARSIAAVAQVLDPVLSEFF